MSDILDTDAPEPEAAPEPEPTVTEQPEATDLPDGPSAEPAPGAPAMPEDVPDPEPVELTDEEKADDAHTLHAKLVEASDLIPALKNTDTRIHGALTELEVFLAQFIGKLKGAIDGTLAGI